MPEVGPEMAILPTELTAGPETRALMYSVCGETPLTVPVIVIGGKAPLSMEVAENVSEAGEIVN
ncbi:hypothetical protein GCM10011487_60930 [Steroidobacter agaridevorans]|uniref:Uncharacterized protein n=1 Tax=Steroidobacter agaridevorans TaxID=2695856 RepID=A0A829YMP4_9GAMM|nr:hypothetical protein GCM10011487_60930 [Steroidobacter agaridevorans]